MAKLIKTGLIGAAVILLITAVLASAAIRVNVMPDGVRNIAARINTAYAWPDTSIVVWGNVTGGTAPYTYVWDFGDGTAQASGSVADVRYIAVNHTYATTGPKYATLVITDGTLAADTDIVRIDVVPVDMDVRINLAIERGMRWLYLQNLNAISWRGWGAEGQYRAATFGMEALAFMNRGHYPTNDADRDIYAEHVQNALNIMLSRMSMVNISAQASGNPDTDGDGKGIAFSDGTRPLYETGIALMVLVGTGTPDKVATSRPAAVIDSTYRRIAQQAIDYLAFAQENGSGRGGWRYTPNYGSSDNSVAQWPTIGLQAAEKEWGLTIPAFVKSELQIWTNYSQNANGGFGYDNAGSLNIGRTGAGICELSFLGVPSGDNRITRALSYLNTYWLSQGCSVTNGNFGNYYAMYGVAKGCRIATDSSGQTHEIQYIGAHEWQLEYDTFLVKNQSADGHWAGCNYGSSEIDTDWGLLILERGITAQPVAVIKAPATVPPATKFYADGGGSYHMDPAKNIIEWLWDFDNSNGLDWVHADAIGKKVAIPETFYVLPPGVKRDTFTITLRVKDDSDPSMYDITQHMVIVDDTANHPPIADAGGPYAARPGELIAFDGTGSMDNDSGDYIASYAWDLNGDGQFDDCSDSICERSYSTVSSWSISLMVTDNHGTPATDKSNVTIWISTKDLAIDSDVAMTPPRPRAGDTVTFTATVRCTSELGAVGPITVRFYDGNPEIAENRIGGDQVVPSLVDGASAAVSVSWMRPDTVAHDIYVRVDPDQSIEEFRENNNQAIKHLPDLKEEIIIPTNEWISIYCGAPTLNDRPLTPGDTIKVLDPHGVLCGITGIRPEGGFAFTPIYRDDSTSAIDEGADPGDTLTILVNNELVHVYPPLVWTSNGDRFEVCRFLTEECLRIELHAGWNLISWNVAYSGAIADILAPIRECVDEVLGFDRGAFTYDPEMEQFSTLFAMDYFHGYWVKIKPNCDTALRICGQLIQDPAIPLYRRWNLVSYWPKYKLAPEIALHSVLDTLGIAYGFDGGIRVFQPGAVSFNTLDSMAPGFGYWLFMFSAKQLFYPGINTVPGKVAQPAAASADVTGPAPSRSWLSVFGSKVTLDGVPLTSGASIDVYASGNVLCGSGVYTDGILRFTPVYGYDDADPLTAAYPKSGDETYIFVNGVKTYPAIRWSQHGERLLITQLYSSASLEPGTLPKEYALFQNYPNPFNPSTVIKFTLPANAHVELTIYNLLGKKVRTLVTSDLAAGDHSVTWDGLDEIGDGVASGMYLYRLQTGSFVASRKMILMR